MSLSPSWCNKKRNAEPVSWQIQHHPITNCSRWYAFQSPFKHHLLWQFLWSPGMTSGHPEGYYFACCVLNGAGYWTFWVFWLSYKFRLFSRYYLPICLLLAATLLVYGSLVNQATYVRSALGRTLRTWWGALSVLFMGQVHVLLGLGVHLVTICSSAALSITEDESSFCYFQFSVGSRLMQLFVQEAYGEIWWCYWCHEIMETSN